MILHIVVTAYNRTIPLRLLIDSFILQTDKRWKMHVVHDGPATDGVLSIMKLYKDDPRILFKETPVRQNQYGHPIRKMMLKELTGEKDDFVLITNDDNYYVPTFVSDFLSKTKRAGMVYCDTLHSYMQYKVLYTRLKVNYIDMGSFIVRLDIAKSVGFISMKLNADGLYAEQCVRVCNARFLAINYIDKPLFVHN
jgi:glycosyltransferase involved in cell wall biosynthesis